MKFKNYEMENMIATLSNYLERRDMIGYAAAKNIQILQNEAKVYINLKDELIEKYGEPVNDEQGLFTGQYRLNINSDEIEKYKEEIETFAKAEGEPNLYKIKPEDVIGELSGKEILELHWMIEG